MDLTYARIDALKIMVGFTSNSYSLHFSEQVYDCRMGCLWVFDVLVEAVHKFYANHAYLKRCYLLDFYVCQIGSCLLKFIEKLFIYGLKHPYYDDECLY